MKATQKCTTSCCLALISVTALAPRTPALSPTTATTGAEEEDLDSIHVPVRASATVAVPVGASATVVRQQVKRRVRGRRRRGPLVPLIATALIALW
jgi:hypothetical protein